MAIKKWPGAGTNKRVINHEDEAVMGKGIEEEGFALAGRAWEVDLKEALTLTPCRLAAEET